LEGLKERGQSEDLSFGEKTILKWILEETGFWGMNLIHLAQDRKLWQTLVNMLMNLQVPLDAENFFNNRVLISSQEGFCSMELE
jgi:hypothetical protein